jgi:hypothetical protein
MLDDFDIRWVDSGREPRMAADPKYPTGTDLDMSKGKQPACTARLPYPAKRCGWYVIICKHCGTDALISTAGRADDPRSAKLPCKRSLYGP